MKIQFATDNADAYTLTRRRWIAQQQSSATIERRFNVKLKTTHTPGPWYEMTRGENNYQSAICQESTGHTVALTYTSNDADAHLIAAAPELLQALETLLNLSELNEDDNSDNARQAIREAHDTIAKAKGTY